MSQIIMNLVFSAIMYYILGGVTFSICLYLLCKKVKRVPFSVQEFIISVILWIFIINKIILIHNGESVEEEDDISTSYK